MKKERNEFQAITVKKRAGFKFILSRLWKNKMSIVGLVVLCLFVIIAIAAPLLAPHDPNESNLPKMLAGPSLEYPLGNDELGRCILSRIIYGARISLLIGIIVISIGAGIGAPLGVISAYYGGHIDFFMQRVVDAMLSFPRMLLALMLVATVGVGLRNVMIVLGISMIPIYIRLARGSALSVKEEQYVRAARAAGCSNSRIILKHIMPNCMAPIIVQSTLQMSTAILWAAGLGFLGLGVSPPTAEWGAMLNGGRLFIRTAPHVCILPGVAIFLVVLSWNLLGDGLRDALDPKLYR